MEAIRHPDPAEFFSDVLVYNPRRTTTRDSYAEVHDVVRYVRDLIGEDPSGLQLMDYARRLIDAAAAVDEWGQAANGIEEVKTALEKKLFPRHTQVAGPMYKYFKASEDRPLHLQSDCSILASAVEQYYIKWLRNIFGDPNGRYVLAWHDFCRTGAPLILDPFALRRVAVMLLNRAEDKMRSSTTMPIL